MRSGAEITRLADCLYRCEGHPLLLVLVVQREGDYQKADEQQTGKDDPHETGHLVGAGRFTYDAEQPRSQCASRNGDR